MHFNLKKVVHQITVEDYDVIFKQVIWKKINKNVYFMII